MKIKQIHIYGYGKFSDFQIKDLEDFQVFFGGNEAGKSTLMSFIHSIFYGFPTKQQADLRYEPKANAAYGGKILLEAEPYGEVSIERVKGKATGDVTVLLEDGTVETEEFLRKLFKGMDKTMFRNIFSFNLEGIQEVHRLKEEDIGKYLMAAGTVGTDQLLKVEQQLEKELEGLFKPSGRKPKLNVLLKDLRGQDQQLKKSRQQNASYASLLTREGEVEKRLEADQAKLQSQQRELKELEELLASGPLLKEKEEVHKRMREIGEINFPAEGIARLDKIKDQLLTKTSTLKTAEARIEETKRLMEEHALLEGFEQAEAERWISEWPDYKNKAEKAEELKRTIHDQEEEMEKIIRELHYPAERVSFIQKLKLGMDTKAKIKEYLQQFARLEGQLKELSQQAKLEKAALAELEGQCETIERQLVDEQTFKEWKKEYEHFQSEKQLETERNRLGKEVQELEERKKREEESQQRKQKSTRLPSFVFFVLSIGLLVWSLLSSEWILALFAILGAIFSGMQARRRKDGSALSILQESLEEKQKQLKELETLIETEKTAEDTVHRYEAQVHFREEWKILFSRMEAQKQRADQVENLRKKTAVAAEELKGKLDQIKMELGLDGDFSLFKLEEAFELLRRAQQLHRSLKSKNESWQGLITSLNDWDFRLKRFFSSFQPTHRETAQIVYTMEDLLKKERQKEVLLMELARTLKEFQGDALQLENEMEGLKKQLGDLLKAAGTADEEEFRIKAERYEEMKRLKERYRLLNERLGVKSDFSFEDLSEIQEKVDELKHINEQLVNKIENDRHLLAAIRHDIQFLEEGGTYTEHLHRFQQSRSIFNEEAIQWAEKAIALHLLKRIMETYKEDRFPNVIRKATEYFSFLTDMKYKDIRIQPSGKLLVERHDGTLFELVELSRGTGEQLYTSIRLGLVYVLKEEYPFPIIIDDGFVNFDGKRTGKILQLLQNFCSTTQVLLFTCHKHIAGQISNPGAVCELGMSEVHSK